MKIKPRRGSWILAVLFAVAICFPQVPVKASVNGEVVFAYQQGTISQTYSTSLVGKSSVSVAVSAKETQDWKPADDPFRVVVNTIDSQNTSTALVDSGSLTLNSSTYQTFSYNNTSTSAPYWDSTDRLEVIVYGGDGEFWAGNYGTALDYVKLYVDGQQVLTNSDFNDGNTGWTSDLGWQACSGGNGGSPCVRLTAPATSIVVTSLADTTDAGTLRWAIAQANTLSGGINDSITFDPSLSGTITLTSALPAISQNVTITGPGQSVISIDGAGSYRPFMVNSGVLLTLSNLTLKRGQNTNGGLIYNNRGTVQASNVRFTTMTGGSAVFNNNGGAVATYTDCTFDNLSIGVAGDYGSTPALPAGATSWNTYDDSGFQNRTYIVRGSFNNNWAGIYNYRFTKIENSTFSNNTYGANVTGLNRTQIYNSTFNTNSIAVYHNAWIPPTFNMGLDNRLITGNTFINNGTSIYLDDGYNNGNKYQGWSTISNNIWDENGTWIQYYYWNGTSNVGSTALPSSTGTQFIQSSNTVPTTTTTTTTTTIPEPPITYSLNDAEWGLANEGSELTLTAPSGNKFTEVLFASYGTPTGSNGLYRTSSCNSESSIQEVEAVFIGKNSATISADNGVFGDPCGGTYKYLAVVLKYAPTPVVIETTTTTISPTTTNILETIFEPVPEEETPTTVPEEEITTTTIPEPEPDPTPVTVPNTTEAEADQAVEDIFKNTDNPDELGAAVGNAIDSADSPEEVKALVTSLLDAPLTTDEFAAVVDSVFSDNLSTEELSAALDAVFEEPLSDEKFAEVIDAVLDSPLTDEQFAEVVGILESDTVTEEQVATAVDNILENGVTEDQATELATSEKVLESIDGDQAAEIFDEIPVSELTAEEEAALVEAVTNAPEEIKNAFEETIDVYASGLDDYVAVGSNIDVGTRKSLLAATAALSSAAVVSSSGGGSNSNGPTSKGGGSGGGGSGGSGSGTGEGGSSGRKEDEPEEEEEESAEIEGPEGDEEESNFTRNSIFKYEEGTMKKRFSPWGFIKKFSKETAAMAFTISGSVVVFATLSGETRKITLIATSVAFVVHYINAMLQNDEE